MTSDWWGAELLGRGPDSAVWAQGRRAVTRGEFRVEVARQARLLRRCGIGAGSTVALQGSPSFTQLWTLFALWSLGAQVVVVEPKLRGIGLREQFAMCAPQHYITFDGPGRAIAPFRDESEVIFRPLRGGQPARTEHCLIQFTSGTTGNIKAIGRTPMSLLAELASFLALGGMPGVGERVLLLDPVIHSLGLIGGVLSALGTGATAVFAPDLRPDKLFETAVAGGVHAILGNPKHFGLFTAAAQPPPLPALRLAVSGGEVLSREVFERFERQYGRRIGQAYGTTETGIIATDLGGEHGPAVVGEPVPGVDVRVTDGRLQVRLSRSPYLDDGQQLPIGNWLSTNDLATQDPDSGVLRLRGRVGPSAAVAGPDLDLVEMETVLREHEHVTEAVVVLEDEIEAHVEGGETLRLPELTSWCRYRLGRHQLPTRFHRIPAIPRTLNGKLVRNRERLWADAMCTHRW
jgi:acyl-coenzyme A synthetase/AMP-(fatty) acid ligase